MNYLHNSNIITIFVIQLNKVKLKKIFAMIIEEHFTEEAYGVTFEYEPETIDGALVTFSHGDKCVKFDLSKEELNQLLNFMNKINDYIIE